MKDLSVALFRALVPLVVPEGCRLILASEDLLRDFGTRTERGNRVTADWGEPSPEGWYTPLFHETEDPGYMSYAHQMVALDVIEAAQEIAGLDSAFNGDGSTRYPALRAALARWDELP